MKMRWNNDRIYYLGILITSLSMLNLLYENPFITMIIMATGFGMVLAGYGK